MSPEPMTLKEACEEIAVVVELQTWVPDEEDVVQLGNGKMAEAMTLIAAGVHSILDLVGIKPTLLAVGPFGSAKTGSTMEHLDVLDYRNETELPRMRERQRDWATSIAKRAIAGFDNVGHIEDAFSDFLCTAGQNNADEEARF